MTPGDLSQAIAEAVRNEIANGNLTLSADQVPTAPIVTRPKQREHGDWATNIALQLAKPAGINPRALADALAANLNAVPGVAKVEVAGPGFLNITLEAAAAGQLAKAIVETGKTYGHNDSEAGKHINLEFVSANPTGPIHIGGVRWAAVGDSLARILEASGAKVTREYYFNDHGGQIDKFAESLLAAVRGEPTPEGGYGGAYIHDIAAAVQGAALEAEDLDPANLPRAQALEFF
ncbi:MAG: arginine--tRNA ligase, partial [Cellulomonadaceae bacterium]|nr:arginine--tRNA ligase [Cellulomonadaceae bacterium]